jgi:hypothetical protein
LLKTDNCKLIPARNKLRDAEVEELTLRRIFSGCFLEEAEPVHQSTNVSYGEWLKRFLFLMAKYSLPMQMNRYQSARIIGLQVATSRSAGLQQPEGPGLRLLHCCNATYFGDFSLGPGRADSHHAITAVQLINKSMCC